jgi:hypothetical protein
MAIDPQGYQAWRIPSAQLPQPPPHQLRLGLGFRQVGLAFGHHLRRRLAGEGGLARRPARPWRPSSPSIGSNTCGSKLTPAGVRWGPLFTVGLVNTAGALRQSPWTRPPTTGS